MSNNEQPNFSAIIRARYKQDSSFDGRRMRQIIQRKALDYSPILFKHGYFSNRIVEKNKELIKSEIKLEDFLRKCIKEDPKLGNIFPKSFLKNDKKIDFLNVKFKEKECFNNPFFNTQLHHTSINKHKSPINTLSYTPDGRRLLTGNANGEFTLWNSYTYSFETIMQAHDAPIRKIIFSKDGNLIISGDNNGILKFWYLSLNNVQKRQIPSIRDMSTKESFFVTGGDDAIIRVHDYEKDTIRSEMKGHNWDIRVCQVHPENSLILSGGKDNMVKLWDLRSNLCVFTSHQHKNSILSGSFQKDYFLTGSKDMTVREFDLRTLKERYVYRTKKEVTSLKVRDSVNLRYYHAEEDDINSDEEIIADWSEFLGEKPKKIKKKQENNDIIINTNFYKERISAPDMFACGQSDGTITIFTQGNLNGKDLKIEDKKDDFVQIVDAEQENTNDLMVLHNQTVWDICFHPVGHLMASGSMDMTVKIWGWDI